MVMGEEINVEISQDELQQRSSTILSNLQGEDDFVFDSPEYYENAKIELDDLKWLAKAAAQVLAKDPVLLELEAPVKIFGDNHGAFKHLTYWFKYGGEPSKDNKYLFVGDFVDRGEQSVESLALFLAYKIKYPEFVFLTRGNHESAS